MRIGLISDTHCPQRCLLYPAAIGRALRNVDLILHAGDVGPLWDDSTVVTCYHAIDVQERVDCWVSVTTHSEVFW